MAEMVSFTPFFLVLALDINFMIASVFVWVSQSEDFKFFFWPHNFVVVYFFVFALNFFAFAMLM